MNIPSTYRGFRINYIILKRAPGGGMFYSYPFYR